METCYDRIHTEKVSITATQDGDMFMDVNLFLLKVLATDDENERTKLIYGLKNQVAKAGKYVGEEAVQLHGGMGV